uniref:RanBP2-type domain-containing protein n=1 Tax=Arundo donax TaxID=35708 RepID=A0A0A9DUU1_ARUDO
MRPRGRGDDAEDDDDEYEDTTPLRSTPEAEADPSSAPPPAPPQPARAPLSSLVVRPPPPQENGGSSPSAARAACSSSPAGGSLRRGSPPPRRRRDFSPPDPGPRGWERRRSPPSPERRHPGSPPPQRRRFSPPRFQPPRHPRFHDEPQGYRMHSGPSPHPRRQEPSGFDDGPRYTHGYQGGGRGGARVREGSPPYGRGGRSYGRGFSAPGKDFINIDGEYVHRNDPNLSPREGDWICQNPNCGNLNFARRTHCNNCNKYRYAPEVYEPSRSARRGYFSPPPRGPPRIARPPGDRAPPRDMARYRSPPRGWGVGDPRGYAARSPPERAGRFTEPSLKERISFRGEHDVRDRVKFDWPATDDYSQRERPHDGMYLDRSRRRSGSPRGNWANDPRDRSRSPLRNRPMKSSFTGRGQPDDYADPYVSRGRPNNVDAGRSGHGHGGYRPGGGPYPGEDRGDRRAAPAPCGRNEDGY